MSLKVLYHYKAQLYILHTCITVEHFRITGLVDFAHRPEFSIIRNHSVLETGLVSVSRRRERRCPFFGVL
jgi:hypothetical protein